jgi:glucosamine kinase
VAGILLADVGGSSSRWAWLSASGGVEFFPRIGERLVGYNPVNGDADAFVRAVHACFGKHPALGAKQVVVYGAGCGEGERAERMHSTVASVFARSTVEVESDLLGAARGLFGNDSGLALILGTGMNVGYYNGRELHTPMPSLGYLLGDEGSGADIGKHLLRDALYGRMPQAVQHMVYPEMEAHSAVLQEVYKGAAPAAYVASGVHHLAGLQQVPYVSDLLLARFGELAAVFDHFFAEHRALPVRATGSVAHGFNALLAQALKARGWHLQATKADPLQGLVAYHSH